MKKILLITALAAASSSAFALDLKPYVEAQVGYLNTNSIDTKNYSYTSNSLIVNGKLSFDYDSDVAWGGEVGLRDVVIENLRVGASFTRSEIDLNKLSIPGTLTVKDSGGNTLLSANGSVALDRSSASLSGSYTYKNSAGNTVSASGSLVGNNADLSTSAVSAKSALLDAFKQRINLYMLNAYYDFKNDSALTPFVGVGVGFANMKDTKDNEFAYSLSAGAKYNFNSNIYLGLKGSYTRVNGPTSNDGIEINDIGLWKADALIGYEF